MKNFIGITMNKLLHNSLILLFILGFGGLVHSQEGGKREQIKTLKIAFFTERLNLSPEEASIFWPLYNEHETAKESLRKQQRTQIRDRFANLDEISEKEAQQALKQYLNLEEKEEELDKAFYLRIAEEFSAVRTLKLFQAEQDFRRRLLQEYRKRRGQR
jgi:hypothetical protein